jgi:hypothetical protein
MMLRPLPYRPSRFSTRLRPLPVCFFAFAIQHLGHTGKPTNLGEKHGCEPRTQRLEARTLQQRRGIESRSPRRKTIALLAGWFHGADSQFLFFGLVVSLFLACALVTFAHP